MDKELPRRPRGRHRLQADVRNDLGIHEARQPVVGNTLPERRIRYTKHGCGAHSRTRLQNRLYLNGRDVRASAYDQIHFPACKPQLIALAMPHEISGANTYASLLRRVDDVGQGFSALLRAADTSEMPVDDVKRCLNNPLTNVNRGFGLRVAAQRDGRGRAERRRAACDQLPIFFFSTSIRAATLPPFLLMTEANSWRCVSARLRPSIFTSEIL
jgi:hypothetical protein